MEVYRKRGATVILNNKCDGFNKMVNEMTNKYNQICQEIYGVTKKLIMNKQIHKKFYGSFCDFSVVYDSDLYHQYKDLIIEKESVERKKNSPEIVTKHYTLTTAKLVKTVFKEIFDRYGFLEDGIANYKRSITKHALDRIESNLCRNDKNDKKKDKFPKISFHSNSLHISEGLVYDDEKLEISIPLSEGKVSVPIYQIYSKGKLKKNFGGNFIYKYNKDGSVRCIVLIAAVDIVEEASYNPNGFIGFDVNQAEKDWITFDDGQKIARPKEITAKIEEKSRLNYEISNQNKKKKIVLQDGTVTVLRTKERRKRRLQQRPLLNLINRMTYPFARQIVDKAVSQGKGVAIDRIAPGAGGAGEFGQFISEYVQQICEDEKIPFYVIPSPYTSQRCSKCGHEDPKNRSKDDFVCLSCGFKAESHINAANNIKNVAQDLYNRGYIFNGIREKSVKTLVSKLEKLQELLKKKVDIPESV